MRTVVPGRLKRQPGLALAAAVALVTAVATVSFGHQAPAGAGSAVTLHVVPKGGSEQAGCPKSDPCSLTAAIRQANESAHTTTVSLSAGTYHQTTVIINEDVSIVGAGEGSTFIDGPGPTSYAAPDIVVDSGTSSISNLTIENGWDENEVYGAGGILNAGTLTLDTVDVTDNEGTDSVDGAGGILNTGTLTLSNVTVDSNIGADNETCAGGIANDGTLTIENGSLITTNYCETAYDYGAGGITNGGYSIAEYDKASSSANLTISSSTVSSNYEDPCTGSYNSCKTPFIAGGLMNAGTATLNTAAFTNNSALGSGGGASNLGSLTVIGSNFSGNEAVLNGGAIADQSASGGSTLSISDSIFSSNQAPNGNGGALDLADANTSNSYTSPDTTSVTDTSFSSNSAAADGGAIDNADEAGQGTLSVTNSSFTSNSSEQGGAIDNADNGSSGGYGELTVSDSTFSQNSGSNDGGAIDNGDDDGDGVATISDSTFSQNTAADGGAIADSVNGAVLGKLALTSSTLDANTADVGAAIDTNGEVGLAADILAGSSGDECLGDVVDFGYNVADDGSCDLTGTGSVPDSSVVGDYLGSLANNGGLTETVALLPTSTVTSSPDPAANVIPASGPDTFAIAASQSGISTTSTEICSQPDQRGVLGPAPCSMGAFQLVKTPVVTAVSPDSGPLAGGTTITITGQYFYGSDSVVIGQGSGTAGGLAATDVTVVSPTEITAVTPAGTSPERGNVFVITPAGTSAPTPTARFTYVKPLPSVTGVSPSSGPLAGGTTITITGTGFYPTASVLIGQGHGTDGAVRATNIDIVSPTEITALTPAGLRPGDWDVYVVTSGGTSLPVVGGHFSYEFPRPTASDVTPNSGPLGGGTRIIITGTGFFGTAQVAVGRGSGVNGAVAATHVRVVSPTKIIAVTGSASRGPGYVFVTTSGGTSAGSPSDVFHYETASRLRHHRHSSRHR